MCKQNAKANNNKQTSKRTNKQTNEQTNEQTNDKQTNEQTNDKQTNKQTNERTNERTNDRQTNKQTNKQTEKIKDLSPVQLTVSNPSQSSVDSVSLFGQWSWARSLSPAWAKQWVCLTVQWSAQWCGYSACILALPLDIDSVNQCHKPVHACSDLKYLQVSDKHSL